ncbi:MAG: hypothetical protein LBC96_02930 [Lachnospiraceae bacterium]|jgi:hypothetical protein|nr:hypothetical protein [Lachnospiraceae bacterium]
MSYRIDYQEMISFHNEVNCNVDKLRYPAPRGWDSREQRYHEANEIFK